jgi:hypothetical protein
MDMSETTPHIHNIRGAVMMTLSLYAKVHEDVTDAAMLGALSACLCDALIIRGQTLNDEVLDVIRKTYEVCELQHAMTEKQGETVQ